MKPCDISSSRDPIVVGSSPFISLMANTGIYVAFAFIHSEKRNPNLPLIHLVENKKIMLVHRLVDVLS